MSTTFPDRTPSGPPRVAEIDNDNNIISQEITFTGSVIVNLKRAWQNKFGSVKDRLAFAVTDLRIKDNATQMVAVNATLALATKTVDWNTVVEDPTAGAAGNAVTVAAVADAGAKAGTITDVAGVVTFHFKDGVSQVSDMEALLPVTDLSVKTAGTAATVLHAGSDAFTATPLSGGSDESLPSRLSSIDNGDGTFTIYAYVADFPTTSWIPAVAQMTVRWTAMLLD